MVRFAGVALALVMCAPPNGLAQDADLPPRDPILQIEAGMHTATIGRIGADAGCTVAATGSEDKTVRLWRVSDGKLLRVMHPPIGAESDGKVYAVAMAPDGQWVAAGGFSRRPGHHFVYVFQTATGAMVKSFGPFPQVIQHLAVSPDGQFLAATLRGGQGVRVWRHAESDLASWRTVAEDREYGGRDSTGAVFDREGALYTVGYDRKIRRYAPGFERRPESLITAGLEPHSISADPAGGLIAVGYDDGSRVDVYETAPLRRSFAVEAGPEGSGALNSVAWSGDGKQLFAAGSHVVEKSIVVKVWDDRGRGPPRNIRGPRDAVMHLFPCAGGVAVAAADPAFGLVRSDGARPLWHESVGADMRGKLQGNFTVSSDGMRVRFGLQEGSQEPVLLEMPAGVLANSQGNPDDLYPPDERGLPISNWLSSEIPKLDGNVLELAPHERSQSVAVTSDKAGFILGSDYNIRRFDKDGSLRWQIPAPGVVWGVNVARQSNLVVAACGDGTLRWYRLEDGALLLSVFIHRADRRWIAWTPAGFFTTSVGAEDLIGWTVNRTWSEAADFFAVSQFRQTFYRPDIVKQVLADAISGLVVTAIEPPKTSNLVLAHLPPVVRIVSPGERSVAASNDVTVTYVVRSPSGMPVKKVSLYVDGVPVTTETSNGQWVLDANKEFVGKLKARIPSRDVEISLVAETEESSSLPAVSKLLWWKQEQDTTSIKPNLYAVLIGVGSYADASLKLQSPPNDVDDFEILLNQQKGKAFGGVTTVKLKDSEATRQNIIDKLIWLKDQVQAPEDLAMVYFSGHGKNLPGGSGSFLLPVDFDGEPLRTGISKAALSEILKQINGGLILFVDACYAANGLDTVDFLNETSSWTKVRVITYASSNRTETSLTKGRNSFFTSALVDAFGGNAPHRGNALRTDELGVWLTTIVPRLAAPGKQTPQMTKSTSWQHVPIAYDQ
jgi:WD40 repeat protein